MVKGNTWLWASVERTEQHEAVAFTQAKLILAEQWQPTALCPVGCRACCSRTEHPPLAGTPPAAETEICCFPGSKGRLEQSAFGWETSKSCCSEPVSSLPSFQEMEHLPMAEMEIAGLQNPVSCLLFSPQVVPGHWEKGLFFFPQLCWPNPTPGKIPKRWEVAPCYLEDMFGTRGLEQSQESHPLLAYPID